MNVYFLGAGNIGRRHIQSTLEIDCKYNYHIIEKCQNSIEKSKEVIQKKENYFFHKSLPKNKISTYCF